ncbi:hypothetical protein HPULCUR_003502 [Helicostylum pulchrum]|uniref:Cas12f1-like TNB domain-containing protein n=1 Tax=Helicostylum pulchrum TaxID=562976 RepID=A0ABP9XTK9_9FUNG
MQEPFEEDPLEDNQEPVRKIQKKKAKVLNINKINHYFKYLTLLILSDKDTSYVEQAIKSNQNSETEGDALTEFRQRPPVRWSIGESSTSALLEPPPPPPPLPHLPSYVSLSQLSGSNVERLNVLACPETAQSITSSTGVTDIFAEGVALFSREGSIFSEGAESVSSVMSERMKKKSERATAKAAALKEVGPKYLTSKKRACKDCGTPGHASMANKNCRRHEEHLRKPKKSRFVIKTSLKNTINLANEEANTSFCAAVQKTVSHCRDVTSATSLFVNFFVLELLSEDMTIPSLTHTFLYDFASLAINLGTKALPNVAESFNRFKEMLGDTYIPERFHSQGFTTTVTEVIRSYSALIHNYVADNYKRSLRYFFTSLSSTNSEFRISYSTAHKRELAEKIFDSVSNNTNITYKESMNFTELQKAIITRLKIESARLMGPLPLTTANVGARPHLYLPWLYHVLQRMEQVDSIKEHVPEKKANREHHVQEAINIRAGKPKFVTRSFTNINKPNRANRDTDQRRTRQDLSAEEKTSLDRFVEETRDSIATNTFRPEKYTDPRGARLFTMISLYSTKMRYIPINRVALAKLLRNHGITNIPTKSMTQLCWEAFDMSKIGFESFDQLNSPDNRKGFTVALRTDGVGIEFICDRSVPAYSLPLTPSDVSLKVDLSSATVWGVDPGLRDVFVAADGSDIERHRIRRTTTNEYYQLAGFKKARITRGKIDRGDAEERAIISATPSLKTSSLNLFNVAASYIFNNFVNMTLYYDRNLRFNKLKFRNYIKKQQALSEISKRLLTESKKYDPTNHMTIENSTKKWKQTAPADRPEETNKPIVIAFGAATFGNLGGNVPARTKVVKEALIKFARERNKKAPTYVVMVNEYLTSQICPRCQTRTNLNEKNNSGSKIHPVLKCSTCDTRWNRDHMASMNIRSIFLHMAQNNNNRLEPFRRL